jgi:glycine hydroxymethyltransferase
MSRLEQVDPEIAKAIHDETVRQSRNLELIASENFVSEAVLEAVGSVMTNKYAEGYPGKRYYGGCEIVTSPRSRHQPGYEPSAGTSTSAPFGPQANTAALTLLKPRYRARAEPGPRRISRRQPDQLSGWLQDRAHHHDTDASISTRCGSREAAPAKLVIAAARRFAIDSSPREIADEVDAVFAADIAHPAGLVAAGPHPSPVGIADVVTTTTHKTLRGPRGGMVMCRERYAKDLDRPVLPGIQGGPLMHVIAAKAVAFREAQTPEWRSYQGQIVRNARALADGMLARGYRLVSGGTDTHLLLVDLTAKGITGKDAQEALDRAWITVNKNGIPFDTKGPMVTSGVRIGTPAVTTRGMAEADMVQIAALMDRVLTNIGNASVEAAVRGEVQELTSCFPLYPERLT